MRKIRKIRGLWDSEPLDFASLDFASLDFAREMTYLITTGQN
jgi:hypothetical protein